MSENKTVLFRGEVYKLQYPFEFGQTLFEEINIERPKTKDLRGLGEPSSSGGYGISKLIDLVASCSGLTELEVDKIDASDMMKLIEKVSSFL